MNWIRRILGPVMTVGIPLVTSVRLSWIRQVLAGKWLWFTSFWGFPVGSGVTWLMWVHPVQEYSIGQPVAGAFVGAAIGFSAFRLVHYSVERLNGAPFLRGDDVQILSSPHCGKVVCVYDEWPERGQVRVDLGDDLKRDVEDVFSYVELRRVNPRQRDCGE